MTEQYLRSTIAPHYHSISKGHRIIETEKKMKEKGGKGGPLKHSLLLLALLFLHLPLSSLSASFRTDSIPSPSFLLSFYILYSIILWGLM